MAASGMYVSHCTIKGNFSGSLISVKHTWIFNFCHYFKFLNSLKIIVLTLHTNTASFSPLPVIHNTYELAPYVCHPLHFFTFFPKTNALGDIDTLVCSAFGSKELSFIYLAVLYAPFIVNYVFNWYYVRQEENNKDNDNYI